MLLAFSDADRARLNVLAHSMSKRPVYSDKDGSLIGFVEEWMVRHATAVEPPADEPVAVEGRGQ